MQGFDVGFPDIVKGRSLIKKNKRVIIDLNQIRDNKLTILNHIWIPEGLVPSLAEGLAEGLPPGLAEDLPPKKDKGLKEISQKKANFISTSQLCVHL